MSEEYADLTPQKTIELASTIAAGLLANPKCCNMKNQEIAEEALDLLDHIQGV